MDIKNIAYYRFFKPAFDLAYIRKLLLEKMLILGVKGTVLLAPEGINCSLSAKRADMDAFLKFLFETINLPEQEVKVSYGDSITFKRSLVKIKRYIVAEPGESPIDINAGDVAPFISAKDFHQWLKNKKTMIVLDTRNDYEFKKGHFKSSVHLGTQHFSQFESDLNKVPESWKSTPIVTFCTGGIRCEKAAPLMLKKGFQQVYQLHGGILNYFKQVGQGFFEGECFVFDDRVAVAP